MSTRKSTPARAWFMDTTAERALDRVERDEVSIEAAASRFERLLRDPRRKVRVVRRGEGGEARG